jgi:arylsulfate sulfotransferase
MVANAKYNSGLMIRSSKMRGFVAAFLTVAVLAVCPLSRALTILSGPTFTLATNAPLAGLLQLTTDVPSRVSVLVEDGTNTWERDFYDFSTTHSLPLLGFEPDRTNQILVTVYDEGQNAYTAPQVLTFVTAPLPADFPTWTVLKDEPSQMEPGYMLFIISVEFGSATVHYITIMNNSGQVVWYAPDPAAGDYDVRQLTNGDLFVEEPPPADDFLEINMLGQTVRTWYPPAGYPETPFPVNGHDADMTDHGTILYLSDTSRVVTNFPMFSFPITDTESNAPLGTETVDDNPIVEVSATNGALLNQWSPMELLDPTRVSYLTGDYHSTYGLDNEHANAVLEDTNDNSIIVSLRDQNAVFDFSRSTGELQWILGPHEGWGTHWQPYLLAPVGTPFEWNYGQHGPDLTPQGTLLVYNDGAQRAMPFDPPVPDQDNYSDAVEYRINDTNMTVSEVWNSSWQTNQDRLYSPILGKTQWLPTTRNVLVTYGFVTYVNGKTPSPYATNSTPLGPATMVRIEEYTHDPVPQVAFDLSFFDYDNTSSDYAGYFCYRAEWVSDLYPHPAEPVNDLVMSRVEQIPILEFSADPTHNYLIQASTDLTHWTTIGTPVQDGSAGDYYFDDLDASQFTTRFYRVVTQ